MIKSTYENCKLLIMVGRVSGMLNFLSLFVMVGAISNDEFIELTGLLPKAAEPTE